MSSQKIDEISWLLSHPQFEERPATLSEFLGPGYLDIDAGIRVGVRQVLVDILGEEVNTEKPTLLPEAMSTGGVGIGKTTLASIILCYVVHWTLCLKDPQGYFNLLPGSRIAFAQAATRAAQAKEVVFGDVKARVNNSDWFKKYPYDKSFKNQMRFPSKDVWIVPGDSTETGYEGYNVLGFIIDEMDSHKETETKSYAESAYTTLSNRTRSRYGNRGFGILIGQMKSASGFANAKMNEFLDNDVYVNRMTIWESWGWDAYADPTKVDLFSGIDKDGRPERFYYDVQRKEIIPEGLIYKGFVEVDGVNVLEIPKVYLPEFKKDPVKALRDLAGIPPLSSDPFITLAHKILECPRRFENDFAEGSPIDLQGRLETWFRAPNSIPRVAHVDIGYSPNGDALGFAMGHVHHMVETDDGELKPYIVFDLLKQWRAKSGKEIHLNDVRQFIYSLRDLGFRLNVVTFDGFQSTDFRQQLERRRIQTDYVSMDKELTPYYDLKDAIYEDRVAWPRLMVPSLKKEGVNVDLAYDELSQLVDDGRKIDHTHHSTKDLADAMAGVTFTLMGDRRYHRKRASMPSAGIERNSHLRTQSDSVMHPAFVGDSGIRAPRPRSARKVRR